jgi:anti-anti-sigma factor
MQLNSVKKQNAVLVEISGRMDALAAPDFETACASWIEKGEKQFVVDMTGLDYISSMGIRSMLSLAKKLQNSGGRLALCGLSGAVHEVFKIAGLLTVLTVVDSPEAGIGNDRSK